MTEQVSPQHLNSGVPGDIVIAGNNLWLTVCGPGCVCGWGGVSVGQGVCLPGGVSVEWCVRTWVYVSTWEGVCGVVCANLGVCVYLGGGCLWGVRGMPCSWGWFQLLSSSCGRSPVPKTIPPMGKRPPDPTICQWPICNSSPRGACVHKPQSLTIPQALPGPVRPSRGLAHRRTSSAPSSTSFLPA